MDNKEAIERLQKIDFERSNARDRLAIHHAITMLERVERLIALTGKEGYYRPAVAEILGILVYGEEF